MPHLDGFYAHLTLFCLPKVQFYKIDWFTPSSTALRFCELCLNNFCYIPLCTTYFNMSSAIVSPASDVEIGNGNPAARTNAPQDDGGNFLDSEMQSSVADMTDNIRKFSIIEMFVSSIQITTNYHPFQSSSQYFDQFERNHSYQAVIYPQLNISSICSFWNQLHCGSSRKLRIP